MQIKDFISRILSNIWRHKLRSSLAIFCILFGTFSVIVLSAIGESFYKTSLNNLALGEQGFVVVFRQSNSESYRGFPKGYFQSIKLKDVISLPKIVPEVLAASPIVTQLSSVSYAGRVYNQMLRGVSPDYFFLEKVKLEDKGRFIDEYDLSHNSQVAVIGSQVKNIIFGKDNALHKKILINGVPFTVIGVCSENNKSHELSKDIFVSYQSVKMMYGNDNVDYFFALMKPGISIPQFKQSIRDYFSPRLHFSNSDKRALYFWDGIEVYNSFLLFFLGIRMFLIFCAVMILGVGAIGVANIMFLIVADRVYEIGLYKAFGATDKQILWQIFFEALIVMGIGAFLGIVLSTFMLGLLGRVGLPAWLGEPSLSWMTSLITVVVLLITSLMVAWFPARRAAMLDPTEALVVD